MNKRLVVVLAAGLMLFGFASMANANTLIDFDSYANGQNLNGVNLGGVTLTNPSGVVNVFANNDNGAGFLSAPNSVSSPSGTTNPLVGTFDQAVNFVSLWAGDGGGPDSDSWQLQLFDAQVGGNLLASLNSGIWIGNPYTNLSYSASNIWRFEANWTGPEYGIAYDDLEFNAVPEPATMLLLGTGLVGVAGAARRRKKNKA